MPDQTTGLGRKWILRAGILFTGIILFSWRFFNVLHRQNRSDRFADHKSDLQLEFPTSNFSIERVVGSNLNYTCSFEERPVCCEVIASHEFTSESAIALLTDCTTERRYIPSSYESRHINQAQEIASSSETQRLDKYFEFVYSKHELQHATNWLERVRLRRIFDHSVAVAQHDIDYLSRYEVTRTCSSSEGKKVQSNWVEWIEPLSLHLKHPFSGATCPVTNKAGQNIYDLLTKHRIPFSDLQSTDYVLVQQTKRIDLNNNSEGNSGAISFVTDSSSHSYLLDVSSSYFDSSLFGLLCMYYQHFRPFHEIYSWETVPLDPQLYWNTVPAKYKSKLHQYNISSTFSDANSLFQMIGSKMTWNDFIALKVDVSDMNVAIPVLIHILENQKVSHMIDELLVSIRFRCEIMLHCGWPDNIPREKAEVVLDRVNIMKLFQRLRHLGIRAHVLP